MPSGQTVKTVKGQRHKCQRSNLSEVVIGEDHARHRPLVLPPHTRVPPRQPLSPPRDHLVTTLFPPPSPLRDHPLPGP
eukprot:1157659-Rhodomonas_salina.2